MNVRSVDTVTRWGGEEFLVLMPETEPQGAFDIVERLRKHVSSIRIETDAGHIGFTFSAGVATHISGQTTSQTVARADRALYEAKSSGRNRVESAMDVVQLDSQNQESSRCV